MASPDRDLQPWRAPVAAATRRRWQALRADGLSAAGLIAFHSAHKYLLMAHSVVAYRRLGRLLGDLSAADLDTLADTYAENLFPALSRPATRAGHANALQHIGGYFRRQPLSGAQRQQLQAAIAGYRAGQLPLSVPLRVLQQLLAAFPDDYLARQVYLAPSVTDESISSADAFIPVTLSVAMSGDCP